MTRYRDRVRKRMSIRLDTQTEHALQSLSAPGLSRSAAVRAAVIEAARLRRRSALKEEATDLGADSVDLAEIAAVRGQLGALR